MSKKQRKSTPRVQPKYVDHLSHRDMRLTNEIDALQTKLAKLEEIVASQKTVVDYMYVKLQVHGILPNVLDSANPVRIPTVPQEPCGTPVPTRNSLFTKPGRPLKESPKTISKKDIK